MDRDIVNAVARHDGKAIVICAAIFFSVGVVAGATIYALFSFLAG